MRKGMIMGVILAILFVPMFSHPSFATPTVSEFANHLNIYGGLGAGLAVDQNDNLYIAENNNVNGVILVSKVSPDGYKTVFVPPGVLGSVSALAFDASGNLYVADGQPIPIEYGRKNKVWKVSPDGTIVTFIEYVDNPMGLAFDSQGNLYVASYASGLIYPKSGAIYKYAPDGTLLGALARNFAAPSGISFDSMDNLFMVDRNTNEIYKVTTSGEVSVFLNPGLSTPHSLVFDIDGTMWATYYNSLSFIKVEPTGAFTAYPGGWIGNDATNGIALDSKGNLYVYVNGGRTTSTGAVLKISGLAAPGLFRFNSKIAVSPTSSTFGNVYVSTKSAPQTFTISNTVNSDISIGTLSLNGVNPTEFTRGADNCSGKILAPSASCTVQVSFAPASSGLKNANLVIPSNASATPNKIALNGTGITSTNIDSDGDGIPDAADKCPNTPPGTVVDANGCEVTQCFTQEQITLAVQNAVAEKNALLAEKDAFIAEKDKTISIFISGRNNFRIISVV